MGTPEYIVIINDSFTYMVQEDQETAIKQAIDLFYKNGREFENEYYTASEEEKSLYTKDIDTLIHDMNDISTIRVYLKS